MSRWNHRVWWSQNGDGISGRNYVINPRFDIAQRAVSSGAAGYTSLDRWRNGVTGSTNVISQEAFAIGQSDVHGNPKHFARCVVGSITGAGNNATLSQRIEDATTFADGMLTISFHAKADSNKNIAVEVYRNYGTGGTPSAAETIAVTTIALTTIWAQYKITVPVSSVSGKTLGTNGDDWIGLIFWMDAGSDFDARTNSLGHQSGTFEYSEVKAEAGSSATTFVPRPHEIELGLCERYYQKVESIGGGGYAPSIGLLQRAVTTIMFTTTMRAPPTISQNSLTLAGNGGLPLIISVVKQNGAVISAQSTVTGSLWWYIASGDLGLDAEL